MSEQIRELLLRWIERQSAPAAFQWLGERLDEARRAPGGAFDLAYARVPRQLGRASLTLTPQDIEAAQAARPGWTPGGWSVDGAARVLLLLHLPRVSQGQTFAERFRRLRQSADPAEQIALFRGLPLYAAPAELENEAAEGLRSNIMAVFAAIAHDNPYPRENFDEHRWNHMVLKALFIGCPLAPIQGLDERANPRLASILRDFARERHAAGRAIPAELWRCLAPYATEVDAVSDLERAMEFRR